MAKIELKLHVARPMFSMAPTVSVVVNVEHEDEEVAQEIHERVAALGSLLASDLSQVRLAALALPGRVRPQTLDGDANVAGHFEPDEADDVFDALDRVDLVYIHNVLSRPGADGERTRYIQHAIAVKLAGPPPTRIESDYVWDGIDEREVDFTKTDGVEWEARGRAVGLLYPSDYDHLYRERDRQHEAIGVLKEIASNAVVMNILSTSYGEGGTEVLDRQVRNVLRPS